MIAAFVACAESPASDVINSPNNLFDGSTDASCTGRSCERASCGSHITTLKGRVMDPAGLRPVYGAAVYVPNADLKPLPTGANCRRCADIQVDAAVSALTDENGNFELRDVPVQPQLPVVVELGTFRRVTKLDIAPCADNVVPTGALDLPRSADEGDLPHIAVTTGGADSLECLVRGMGIFDSEFQPGGSATGHVHVYRGRGGGGFGSDAVPEAASFWNDYDRLKVYDLVGLSCEGEEALDEKGGTALTARGAMHDYAVAGGHVFATHFHRVWLQDSPFGDFRGIAEWGGAAVAGPSYDVDTSFPKGKAFAAWLTNVGASTTPGSIDLPDVTFSVGAVHEGAQAWIKRGDDNVRYFSFNAPLNSPPEEQCGRVVFGDLHVSGHGGGDLPGSCGAPGTPLTPEQLALEFLLFDTLACVQDDKFAPTAPR